MKGVLFKGLKEKAMNGVCYSLAIFLVFCLKQYYSHAEADDLLWILAPVATLVQWIGNIGFTYEPYSGFISRDYGVIIAPACAGVNLLIVFFAMAVFAGVRHMVGIKRKIVWLVYCALAAYVLVIGVNAVRIYLSIVCYTADIKAGWLTPHRCHRLLGIVIYFFFHCLFYFIMADISKRVGGKKEGLIGRTVFYALTPLGWYLGITVGVPLFKGAHRNNAGQFTEHALFVISISTLMLGIFVIGRSGLRYVMRKRREKYGFSAYGSGLLHNAMLIKIRRE